MKKLVPFSILAAALLLAGCQKDAPVPEQTNLDDSLTETLRQASPTGETAYFKLPESNDLASIPQDPKNPLTIEKITLGKLLYHETGLGIFPKKNYLKETYSCASCHNANAGFQAGVAQGLGEGGQGFGHKGEGRTRHPLYADSELDVQPLRTPSAMNIAYQENILWNGQFGATGLNVGTEANWTAGTPIATNLLGFEGTETQAIAGLTVHRMGVDDCALVSEGATYHSLFDTAFPDVPQTERYTRINAGLAIAAYERVLLANRAPFQLWLRGDYNALPPSEKRGAILFFGKAQCGDCHTGPALSSMSFHAYGMGDLSKANGAFFVNSNDPAHHLGRGSFTKRDEDNYKFKVPQLYNLADSPFYGHGSSFRSIKAVVDYKNKGIAENSLVPASQLSPSFKPLGLTDTEVQDITAFLSRSLYDPNLGRYLPENLPSNFCFPNNDPLSKQDLGCN